MLLMYRYNLGKKRQSHHKLGKVAGIRYKMNYWSNMVTSISSCKSYPLDWNSIDYQSNSYSYKDYLGIASIIFDRSYNFHYKSRIED